MDLILFPHYFLLMDHNIFVINSSSNMFYYDFYSHVDKIVTLTEVMFIILYAVGQFSFPFKDD